MSSPISLTILHRSLLLISVVLLTSANTVLAENRSGDALTQARDLLSGTVSRSRTIEKSQTVSAGGRQKSQPDVQEQARQVILGRPKFDGVVRKESAVQLTTHEPESMSARRDTRVETDPQESIHPMNLGTEGSGTDSNGVRISQSEKAKQ